MGAPALCAFCLVNQTTATLEDGTPIDWRPCYSALLKMQYGMFVAHAVREAFDEVPDGWRVARHMTDAGVDVERMYQRLVARLLGANAVYGLPALGAGTGATLALPAPRADAIVERRRTR